MRVLVAPNALKGSLAAVEASQAMARGVQRALPAAEIDLCPVADGGDGFVQVLAILPGMQLRRSWVSGPLGRPVQAGWLYRDDAAMAVIDVAGAAGLGLLEPCDYDVMHADTRGVGELVCAALDVGARRILIGAGGSAGCDGGTGLAAALGVRFRDRSGRVVPAGGHGLVDIVQIDLCGLDPRLRQVRLELVCDVDSPLLGPCGAARLFAPQKGADAAQVERLEAGLAAFAGRVEAFGGSRVRGQPGAGAAGGLAVTVLGLLGGRCIAGALRVLDLLDFDRRLMRSDLVLSAEGCLDRQTLRGKAPAEVARHARGAGVPCMLFAGRVEDKADMREALGAEAVVALADSGLPQHRLLREAERLLEDAVARTLAGYC
ncbi:MAG TPA: glycerate kinase [Gammaproteobacteria bacterium]|nr:glycerate kinase [Gammaproteobacteria bacterium]